MPFNMFVNACAHVRMGGCALNLFLSTCVSVSACLIACYVRFLA